MTGLLLDTHVLLWANAAPERLGRNAVAEITQIGSNLFVSAVTVAEIAIKRSIGKLRMTLAISDLLAPLDARELALSMAHAEALERLPMLHRDPFDRLLAVQARLEELTLVTKDPAFRPYGLRVVWE